MNILIYDLFGSFQIRDVEYCLDKLGHKYKTVFYKVVDKYNDESFCVAMRDEFNATKWDMVFTTNYYPIVSRVCYELNTPYCAWVYDSPPEIISTDTMDYPTNRIFFFTKHDYIHYKRDLGLDTVFYLPLGVNVERLTAIPRSTAGMQSDVSLVGTLYSSDDFLNLRSIMTPEQQRYLDAVLAVQLKKSGGEIIELALSDSYVAEINAGYRAKSPNAIQPIREQFLMAAWAHATHIDRLSILRLCGDRGYKTSLYIANISDGDRMMLTEHNVLIHAPVSYHEDMPKVFRNSRININPTTRANRTGISLRAVDVMGCEAFLLTNHLAEMDEFFNDDEIATYECLEEAMDKIEYYLAHDDERMTIAHKGYERVSKDFSFMSRVQEILSYV